MHFALLTSHHLNRSLQLLSQMNLHTFLLSCLCLLHTGTMQYGYCVKCASTYLPSTQCASTYLPSTKCACMYLHSTQYASISPAHFVLPSLQHTMCFHSFCIQCVLRVFESMCSNVPLLCVCVSSLCICVYVCARRHLHTVQYTSTHDLSCCVEARQLNSLCYIW